MTNIKTTLSARSIEELNDIVQHQIIENFEYFGTTKHFRGHADIDFQLQTRLAAKVGDSMEVQILANKIFNSFRNEIGSAGLANELYRADMNQGMYEKPYYYLFQAQHLGIPTPFMDWSLNWRNALYFVIDNKTLIDKPGKLWVMLRPFYEEENVYSQNPFFLESSYLINAPYHAEEFEKFLGEKRRRNQGGQFFVSAYKDCIEPLETNKSLESVLIAIEIQPELKKQFYEYQDRVVDDEMHQVMQSFRIDFNHYNSDNIYGHMSSELKTVVNNVRTEFGFSAL